MNPKPKPLNSTQKTALGWAKARGGKIRLFGRDLWKPGIDPNESRIIGRNTVVSLLRRGVVRESARRGSMVTEVEIVPEGEIVLPESVPMAPKAQFSGVYLKRV